MVRTWSRQWFASEGARVIYVVPRATTDALLPLQITPRPDALVRVLVGRLEYMEPETEARVEKALAGRLATDAATRKASQAELDRLGRFQEPHVRRVLATTKDETVQKSARELLGVAGR